MRLTDSRVKALKPKSDRYIEWEGQTGFGVRVAPTGRKTFVFMYRFDGKPRMLSIGVYPKTSLGSAKVHLAQARKKIEDGTDPGVQRRAEKKANKEAPTVVDLAKEFMERYSKKEKKTWKYDEWALEKDILPAIGKLKAKEVKRRDIILTIDRITDRNAPGVARRTLAVVRKMFSFGVTRGIIDHSPCIEIPAPAKPQEKDRVLSEPEIKIFWEGVEKAPLTDSVKLALKFLLVTGQRRGETVASDWEEIDLSEGWWNIPSSRTKSGRPHRVPLNGVALKILSEAKKLSKGSPWVFPSTKGKSHVQAHTLYSAVRKNNCFGLKLFGPHDLRRTVGTHLPALKVERLTVSKLLNHSEGGVTKIYDKYAYDHEKQSAMRKWSRRLEVIISGKAQGKIIQLQK